MTSSLHAARLSVMHKNHYASYYREKSKQLIALESIWGSLGCCVYKLHARSKEVSGRVGIRTCHPRKTVLWNDVIIHIDKRMKRASELSKT